MITVRQLFDLPVFQGSEILAGEKGVDHPVRCIDIAEVPDPSLWLDPGVFILTTAYAFHKEKRSLMFFLESLVRSRAAGLGIKLGRFLDELPREFGEYADKFNMPVILLPLELRYTHAIRSVTEAILKDEERDPDFSDLSESLSKLLFCESYEDALATFEAAGISRSSKGVVLMIAGTPSETAVLTSVIAGIVQSEGDLFAVVRTSSETLILSRPFVLEEHDFSKAVKFFPKGTFVTSGGEYSLEEIRSSYEEAKLCRRLLKIFASPEGAYSKAELEVFFPFLQGESSGLLKENALRLLSPVIEYDSANRTSLLQTLWMFMLCDCDHAKTAQRLHLHRNSLRYRLAKIRRLLPENSLNGVAFHRLFLALMIYFAHCAPCTN